RSLLRTLGKTVQINVKRVTRPKRVVPRLGASHKTFERDRGVIGELRAQLLHLLGLQVLDELAVLYYLPDVLDHVVRHGQVESHVADEVVRENACEVTQCSRQRNDCTQIFPRVTRERRQLTIGRLCPIVWGRDGDDRLDLTADILPSFRPLIPVEGTRAGE